MAPGVPDGTGVDACVAEEDEVGVSVGDNGLHFVQSDNEFGYG